MSILNTPPVIRGGALVGALTALALGVLSCASTASERASTASRVQNSTRNAAVPMRFAVVADRTGGHRPGVFREAVAALNLLAPDFVMSVGDFIEGYTTDATELERQWDEFNAIIGNLEPEFIRVPGNHDLSNQESHAIWNDRFGPTFSAFVRDRCLFLCLNSEDPTSGHIGTEQLEFMSRALSRYHDVRWTFVFLHEPLWSYANDTGWDSMEALLGDRPRTVFAGHMHTYRRELRNGYEYITLGTTGGASRLRGANYGEVDHIAWVTIGEGPPHIANIELDGIWSTSMYTDALRASFQPVVAHRPLHVKPVLCASTTFRSAEAEVLVSNPTPYPLTLTAYVDTAMHDIYVVPNYLELAVPAGETATRVFAYSSSTPLPKDAVPALAVAWKASYEVPARPPISTQGTAKALVLPEGLHYDTPVLPVGANAAEIVDTLYATGHEDLAVTAIDIYTPCTRTTEDALALITAARSIGYQGTLGMPLGFVCDWYIGEPAPWKFSDGLSTVLPHIPAWPRSASEGMPVDTLRGLWSACQGNLDTGVVDLVHALGTRQDAAVFAATTLAIEEGGDAIMHLRSDDGVALWLNGARVHANNVIRGVSMGEDHVPVRLRRGDNLVVIEVTQGIEGWAFSVRVTRPDGTPYPFTVG